MSKYWLIAESQPVSAVPPNKIPARQRTLAHELWASFLGSAMPLLIERMARDKAISFFIFADRLDSIKDFDFNALGVF